jgi:uncharacterized SAM-binding protein YcdF (DUF218 family)
MDFISLSKILPLLVLPFTVVLWFMLAALVLLWFHKGRWAGGCIAAAIVVFVVCGNSSFSYALYAQHERIHLPLPAADYPEVDAIVVLGGSLSPPLSPRLYMDLSGSTDRIWHGVRLFRAGRSATIVLSGGNVFPQPGVEGESLYAAQLMEEWGVPRSAILIEDRSRNTYENALYSKELLDKNGLKKVLLVTSALHMPRALRVFRSNGIDAIAAPTDYNVVDLEQPGFFNWIPNLGAMSAISALIRENLGIIVYRYRGWITAES